MVVCQVKGRLEIGRPRWQQCGLPESILSSVGLVFPAGILGESALVRPEYASCE